MNYLKILKSLAVALLFCAQTVLTQAQHTCASDAINDTLLANDPIFYMGLMQFEQVMETQRNISTEERSTDIYNLPVVVHIIHKGEPYGAGTNITDEQIFSAISALNNDFRRVQGTNGYGSGPDIGIEFCLAVRDPNGQPTTGINRIDGRVVPNYEEQGIAAQGTSGASETAVKALSTWPRTSYVNIWVVSEIENNNGLSGIQGYAYFPVNNPVDGIVLLFNAFGTVGTLKSYTNLNRTLTHEIGHYLGLYHTFHSTTACGAEGNCNTAGDKICDTPVTVQSSSCSAPACSGTQQVQNYMDYTGQLCQNMFTEGQKLRMRTTLEAQRTSMITSMGCTAVNNRDAGITSVLSPSGNVCSGSIQPTVTLSNFGSTTLTSVTINYNLNGSGSNTQTWTGSLASGSSTTVTLNSITPAGGGQTLYAWTSNPNGQSDQNTSNDQSTGAFTVATGGVATLRVRLDYFGSENTWRITDSNSNLMVSGGPYIDMAQGTIYNHNICLPPGCYTLTFYDLHNDGQSFTNGNFLLLGATGDTLVFRSGNWGQSSVNPFCLTASTSPPVASLAIVDNTICRNTSTGFTSTSSGSPTSYNWTFEGGSPATSTAQNPQNISYTNPGSYDVVLTVSSANGSNTYTCTDCMTVYALPTVTLTGTNPVCNNGQTGSVTSSVAGVGPYTYSWNTGAVTANLNNVASGAYSLTVTNPNGCSNQASTTLNNPTDIAITGTTTNAGCSGANTGSITVSATGGTGTKTFSWSNGVTGATVSNLVAGNYTVTATDAAGCTKTQSFTLTAPSAIIVTGTVTPATCSGGNNGSITVSSTGGTGTKTFSWSNGVTGATVSNLVAGNYTVTATDAAGCTKTQSFTLTAPSAIMVTGTVTPATCNGGNNGSITATATGGTGSKTFSWSTGATGAVISDISAGTYMVTVTDVNNCTATQSFIVNGSSSMVINGVSSNPTCQGAGNGVITVNITGGTGTINYNWSNGATTSTISNLAAGVYSVLAQDAAGCSISQSFTLTAPAPVLPNVSKIDITCSSNTGSAQVAPAGGFSPYTAVWSNGASGNSVNGLAPGNYTVTVYDNFSCSGTASFTISQTASLTVTTSGIDASCNGVSDGQASAGVQGGTGIYSYLWSNESTTQVVSSLQAGTYGVVVTDGNGCQGSSQVVIGQPSVITIESDILDAECFGQNDGAIDVSTSGGTGPYQYSWSNGDSGNNIGQLSAGDYTVTVTDVNNCIGTEVFTVSQPEILTANVIIIAGETCTGNDGAAEVIASGGNAGYNVYWNNGASGSLLEEVSAGDYSVTIIDINGCNIFANVTIPYDCQQAVPQTQISASQCGSENLQLNALIYCDEVVGADMYHWRFTSEQGIIISDEYSLGNVFYASQIPFVQEGTKYHVGIKVLMDGIWGQFGNICVIGIEGEQEIILPGLAPSACGASITDWGQTLVATEVPNVLTYQWNLTGPNYNWTTYTNINALVIEEAMQLVAGEIYNVKIKCSLGQGEFTDWGPTCTFSVDLAINVSSYPPVGGILHYYPNPNDGEKITFDFGNLPPGSIVEDLEIYTSTGRLVEKMNQVYAQSSGNIYEYRFKNKLASGMYVIRYRFNQKLSEEKLIVR